jgi:Ca2+-binding EF-hand superfamily protein
MFKALDKDGSGKITYLEFMEGFRTLSYGLGDKEINILVSLADEDNNELITWQEFVPTAVEAIKIFYSRNMNRAAQKVLGHDSEAIKQVLWPEIQKVAAILNYGFRDAPQTGKNLIS